MYNCSFSREKLLSRFQVVHLRHIKYIMVKVAIHTVLACYLASHGPSVSCCTSLHVCTIVSQILIKKKRFSSVQFAVISAIY